jgi:hypothetical protein
VADTAASFLTEWNNVLADVKRRLGKKGKLPKPKKDPAGKLAQCATMAKALDADVKKLGKALHQYQEVLADVEGDAYDYKQLIADDEFKLSKADSEEERTINYVRHNLTKCLDGIALGSKSPRKLAAKYREMLEGGGDLSAF